jgi:uncharacterized protein (DUF3084 family)
MLSNKDKLFLAGLQEAMREFVAADIGKVARADLKKLEEAVGGRKKLEDADKILADAGMAAIKHVDKVKAEGVKFSQAAMDKIASMEADLENTKQELAVSKDKLDAQVKSTKLKAQGLENAAFALQSRETAANDRTAHLDCMEKELVSREKGVKEREVEVQRIKEWQAAAPVGV